MAKQRCVIEYCDNIATHRLVYGTTDKIRLIDGYGHKIYRYCDIHYKLRPSKRIICPMKLITQGIIENDLGMAQLGQLRTR